MEQREKVDAGHTSVGFWSYRPASVALMVYTWYCILVRIGFRGSRSQTLESHAFYRWLQRWSRQSILALLLTNYKFRDTVGSYDMYMYQRFMFQSSQNKAQHSATTHIQKKSIFLFLTAISLHCFFSREEGKKGPFVTFPPCRFLGSRLYSFFVAYRRIVRYSFMHYMQPVLQGFFKALSSLLIMNS